MTTSSTQSIYCKLLLPAINYPLQPRMSELNPYRIYSIIYIPTTTPIPAQHTMCNGLLSLNYMHLSYGQIHIIGHTDCSYH